MTTEIKGKAASVELYKENAYQGNDSYNVKLEGDERRFSYLCKGGPKIKVGEEMTFIIDERDANGKKFYTIKVKKENTFTPGSYKARPNYSYALEWARKMYNSSHSTENTIPTDKWTTERMRKVADWLLQKLTSGIDREAIDCAVTIACATAINGGQIDSKVLEQDIKDFNEWVNKNKQ